MTVAEQYGLSLAGSKSQLAFAVQILVRGITAAPPDAATPQQQQQQQHQQQQDATMQPTAHLHDAATGVSEASPVMLRKGDTHTCLFRVWCDQAAQGIPLGHVHVTWERCRYAMLGHKVQSGSAVAA